MPSATGAFGATNVVALFQGFINNTPQVVTRAAQNCALTRVSQGVYQLALNNVSTDDCNFMAQVHQFIYAASQTTYPVACVFPPVGDESLVGAAQTYNYIQFMFYNSSGAISDPNYYGLFNIAVFSCNDSVHQSPGNP